MSEQFVVIDQNAVEEVHREDGEIVAVTLPVVDGPYYDPHEAGFAARDNWSHEFVEMPNEPHQQTQPSDSP